MRRYGGVLLICKETNNFLLVKRSKLATYPHTWSIVSGEIEGEETALEGIKRELWEETKIEGDIDYDFFEINNDLVPQFSFYLGYCPKEYTPKLNHENSKWGWFNMDNLPKNLFPTLYPTLVRIF